MPRDQHRIKVVMELSPIMYGSHSLDMRVVVGDKAYGGDTEIPDELLMVQGLERLMERACQEVLDAVRAHTPDPIAAL